MPQLQSNIKQWVEQSAEAYGNKSANLIVMEEGIKGINIPDICPLSHEMCLKHLDTHYPAWRTQWEAFKTQQGNESGGLAEGTHEILTQLRAGIEQAFSSHPLEDAVILEYLASHFEPGEVLMVRSTGKEDSAELANPGGNESYAGISANIDSVSTACGRVIASYFSEKSLEQRLKAKHVESDSIMGEPFMPVLLQKMIGEVIVANQPILPKKVYSGVMYVNQDGKVTIQEAPGHGELVVNSKGPINSYFILGEGTVHQQINEKPFRVVSYINEAGKAELIVQKNPNEMKTSSLPKEVVERLGSIGKEIQAFYVDDRDIEFVYDEDKDKLFIVQARPIPLGESARHMPSAISPEKIREVKKEAPYYKAKTIAVAASKVEIAEKAGDVIICNTIGDALTMYLDMKDPKIKAVVVARDAPSTSHEAAEFNSVSIPVFYVDKVQKDKIQSSLEQGNKQFIFDPQRGLIVDWTDKGNPDAIVKEGLFKSSISAERTLLPESKMIFAENSIQQAEQLLQGAVKKKGMAYEEVLDQLEIIESTTPQKVLQSREALKQVLMDIIDTCRVTHDNDTQMDKDLKANILKHGVAYSLDVDNLLTKIELSQEQEIRPQEQKQLLDLVNGLEALIANPGRKGLYSDSVYNLMQDFSIKNKLNKKYPMYARLSEDERKVVEGVSQFGRNAANDVLQERWERFVVQIAMMDRGGQEKNLEKLASIVYHAQSNDLGSVLVNNIFSQLDATDFKNTIETLDQQVDQLKLYADRIFSLETKAAELEAKAVLWSKKKNHTNLIKEYEKNVAEVLKCIDSFGPLHALPLVVKAKALGEIAKITDVIDSSIKTMKGSQDYPKEDNAAKDEQAILFYQMLIPYHDLMQKVVDNMADSEKRKNVRAAMKNKYYSDENNTPEERCARIRERFELFSSRKVGKEELFSSKSFQVNRATIDDYYQDFGSSFLRCSMTLEDFFTLFHQNIIAATSNMLSLSEESCPPELNEIVKFVKERCSAERFSLLLVNIQVKNGKVTLSYNIPMDDHAASFTIGLDKKSELFLNYDVSKVYDSRLYRYKRFIENFPKEIGFDLDNVDLNLYKVSDLSELTSYMLLSVCSIANHEYAYPSDHLLFNTECENKIKLNGALCLMNNGLSNPDDVFSFMEFVSNAKYNVNINDVLEKIDSFPDSTRVKKIIETGYQDVYGFSMSYDEIMKKVETQDFREMITLKQFKRALSRRDFLENADLSKFLDNNLLAELLEKNKHKDMLPKNIKNYSDYYCLKSFFIEYSNYVSPDLLKETLYNLLYNLDEPEYMNEKKLEVIELAFKLNPQIDYDGFKFLPHSLIELVLTKMNSSQLRLFLNMESINSECAFALMNALSKGALNLEGTGYTDKIIKNKFMTPYHRLAKMIDNNDEEGLRSLIKNGMDANSKGVDGETILKYAIRNGNFKLVNLLIDLGADPFDGQNKSSRDMSTINMLASATHDDAFELTELFIKMLNFLDGKENLGGELSSALANAIRFKNEGVVELLLNQKAEITEDVCYYAFLELNQKVLSLIEKDNLLPSIYEQIDRSKKSEWRESWKDNNVPVLQHAIRNDNMKILRWMCDYYPYNRNSKCGDDMTPLEVAMESGNIDAVKILIKKRVRLDFNGESAFRLATPEVLTEFIVQYLYQSDRELCEALDAEYDFYFDDKIIKCILDQKNCPINPTNKMGLPLLAAAVLRNNENLVQLLLAHGADPNFGDERSALKFVKAGQGSQTIRTMLETAAEVKQVDKSDLSRPMLHAMQLGNNPAEQRKSDSLKQQIEPNEKSVRKKIGKKKS